MEATQVVRVQKHLFNTKAFTSIFPKYFQFYSACIRMSDGQLVPDPSSYSAFALWFYIFLALSGAAAYGYKLSQKNKQGSYYTKASIELAFHVYLSLYVLHGIMNCYGWTAFGRSMLFSILATVIMAFIP